MLVLLSSRTAFQIKECSERLDVLALCLGFYGVLCVPAEMLVGASKYFQGTFPVAHVVSH